jgi:dihydropteroate synthase
MSPPTASPVTGSLGSEDAVQAAVAQAEQFLQEGADILDIGGESTRPGSQPVDADEELARVIPVSGPSRDSLPAACSPSTPTGPSLGSPGGRRGWVNDVWGCAPTPTWPVAADQVPVILMHNRLKPGSAELASAPGRAVCGRGI